MSRHIFVTGTDTEVGKTYVSAGLLQAFNRQGLQTIGLKPIASDCKLENNKLINADALQLQKHASYPLDYDVINPIAFAPPVAPHIIAEQLGQPLSVARLTELTRPALQLEADITLIEGFGGWYAPLSATETMADYVRAMQFDVLLVVGMRLGCLNHAVLTHRAILADGLKCIGWVANCIDPDMLYLQENIALLIASLPTPCLGIVGHGESAATINFHPNIFSAMA